MIIGKYSFGIGDRFAHQGEAQLRAILFAKEAGIDITPVWNKSHREHITVGSAPKDVRTEADAAVVALNWHGGYLVDADHINLGNVGNFMELSDFFTIDVADFIGKPADEGAISDFMQQNSAFVGDFYIPGILSPFTIDEKLLQEIAEKFLQSMQEAGKIYHYIAAKKGADNFITEVSIDEVDEPQSPVELFFILKMLAQNQVPAQTIAPKFTGRFNKGVDYVGNVEQFAMEFEQDILVIAYAVQQFNLPENLKLSIHSGSDKFSIYQPVREIIRKHNAGIHIKTAGTTWLEELIGLAEAGIDGLAIGKGIYQEAFARYDELTAPYANVIDVEKSKLPSPNEVEAWDGKKFSNTLRHNLQHPDYNPHFRQLLHCSYKIAAEKGEAYTYALKKYKEIVGENVTTNIWERHIKPLFFEEAFND